MMLTLGSRKVGQIVGKRFIAHRNPEHFFIKYNGFGLSHAILETIKRKGVKEVVIIYNRKDGTQEIYKTYPNKFYEFGIIHKFGERDYQRILPRHHFNLKQE